MKTIPFYLFIIMLMFLASCRKKHDYNVHGILINEVTGNGHNMGGEIIQLLRIKTKATFNIFSNPESRTQVATATTDNDGNFDFGIKELKEGDYRIDYVQGNGKTYYGVSNSFKDISLAKGTEINETISVIPTVVGLSCFANPLTTNSVNDTIFVEFISKIRLINNPSGSFGSHLTGYDLHYSQSHSFGGINNTEFMGDIFIKITKSYGGLRTDYFDTIFVAKDASYDYYTPF